MPKIKLLKPYRTWEAGEVLEDDQKKCDELTSLGVAQIIDAEIAEPIIDNKELTPLKKRGGRPKGSKNKKYNTK